MLHLIQSNKMEVLAIHLVNLLKATGQQFVAGDGQDTAQIANIFEPQQVLVQSPGMSQWLKLQIAQAIGITANVEFPLPSSFIWQLYRQHMDDLPEQSSFTKPNMAWKIMAILPDLLVQPEFAPIQTYLQDNPEFKLYQLAQKIADVYDQYLVYRPEWILNWEQGTDKLAELSHVSDQEAHLWQPILWRALTAYSQTLGESTYHRANLHQSLLAKLQQVDSDSTKPLMVFGISAMPTQQLEVLNALAGHREVYIFWFNPSQHYWGDIVDDKTLGKVQLKQQEQAEVLDIGNPLLASWGKLGRDYQDMLLALDIQQQDAFVDIEPASLLQHIQEEVNHLVYRGATEPLTADELLSNGKLYPKTAISHQDKSIQIHLCHSKVRELQVLHDQLLQTFEQHPEWSPADIIVMMPDVSAYAPFIEGVFGVTDKQRHIPYAISDQNYGQISPLINSFISIMKLHNSRGELSDVLSLLEVPAIQRKFDINAQEFELVQHWLQDAGVRWGWDGQDKVRWDLPEQQQNTWLFGLERLLAGYAMSAGHLFVNEQHCISPYADIEGQQAVALGKCYLFIQLLQSALALCLRAEPIGQKVEQALALLENLYLVNEQEQVELTNLRETIEGLNQHASQYPKAISQDVFIAELEQNIQQKGVGQRFLAGYVNFCTLMPMRSIPFKQVCLLGMNDSDYPRQSIPMGFDLMRLAPVKKGDRSRRLDDRYLFLEAILSARETLYISYQGFSQRDNSPRSPSILVNELLEYCQQGYALQADLQGATEVEESENNVLNQLQVAHKLQGYSPCYFRSEQASDNPSEPNIHDNRYISFNAQALSIANQVNQTVQSRPFFDADNMAQPQTDNIEEIQLEALITFYKNPAQAYFEHNWQTRFYSFTEEQGDTEPFSFDGLDKFKINQVLVSGYLDSYQHTGSLDFAGTNNELYTKLRAEGVLPTGLSGQLALQPLQYNCENIAGQIIQLTQSSTAQIEQQQAWTGPQSKDIKLSIDGIKLIGRAEQCYLQNLIYWRTGEVREKDKIECYLTWLALCASNASHVAGNAYYINKAKPYKLPAVSPEQAKQQLSVWVKYYQSGLQQPLRFFPKASFNWANKQDKNKALQAFAGNQFQGGDVSDPHIQRICPDLTQQFDDFAIQSDALLQGLIDLEQQK